MFQNYLKTLWRNMQKNKLHTAINIVGLSVAFTCSILIIIMVYQQFSYDGFHENKKRVYEMYSQSSSEEGLELSNSMAYPVVSTVKAEPTGIEKATRYRYRGRELRYKEKTIEQSIRLVDDDFFSIFSFPVVKGTAQHPLSSLGNVVLNESTSKKLFGDEDPINKTIEVKIGGVWNNLIVTAVIKDAPDNSSINNEVLARTELDPDYATLKNVWNNTQHNVYVMVGENTTKKQVESKLRMMYKKYNPVDENYVKNKGYKADENGDYASFRLMPLEDIHFNKHLGNGNAINKSMLYILLLIAFVIIIIASFNFINLNIGLAFTRTKEIGVRKCLGAGKKQVWLQVWGESFIIVFISMLVGITSAALLTKTLNKQLDAKFDASLLYQPGIVFILLLILGMVSLIASGYPSFIMGKLKTVEVLKGKISVKKPGIFRNALIVTQFVIAITLICTTLVIFQQFRYLKDAPLGYNTASLISIPIKQDEQGKQIVGKMRTLLASQSSVVSVSGSTVNFGVGKDRSTSKQSFGFDYKGKSIGTNYIECDYDILKTLGVQLKEGRDFSTAFTHDSTDAVIITESMAKQLGEKNPVGISFYSDSSRPKWNVIGVIPDFHLYSMHEETEPITISMAERSISYALVRVNTQNPMATMKMLEKTYAQVEPGVEFKGSFVEENIERWYTNESRLSQMFTVAAIVAILLSCMGLFGMAFIIIRQRVKEIGVRKVLGASVTGIAALVTKEFIRPVIIALFIAIPIAWWAMDKWLQDFIYRIHLHWWIFLIAGLMAVVIAIITVSFHAIKAAIANPIKSLRTE